jgi:teichuronic acid biosynthesis glycosyltransferase TuaG
MKYKVAIILPNYNSHNFLKDTISSIFKQSYKDWKLFIVDDCSEIKTKKILKLFTKNKKIKLISLKKNKGAAYCRNLAIKKSKSKYLAFIDSDDLWHKEKLKNQINFMEKNNYYFTYTHYKTFTSSGNKERKIQVPKKYNFNSFIKDTSIATSTMIVKRSVADKIKFSNTRICEDYYYKCQLLKKIGFAHCYPYYLTKYQIRKNSLQSSRIKNLYWMLKINKKFNNFNFLNNLISIFFISFNSIKKYGFK